MNKIEGIATFSEGGFSFESGLPSEEQVVEAQSLMGRLGIKANGCVDFRRDARCTNLPPDINTVTDNEKYKLKRTTRHYIISIKVPVVENRQQSEETVNRLLPKIMGDITIDRNEVLDSVINA